MLQLTVFILVFSVAALYGSPTIYWRDSGEFVLTALYRDIPHQPGSPLYGSLASLASLIPAGPLAWRVNLFGAFCGALFCAMLSDLIARLFPKQRILGALPLLCLSSQAFLRQLYTAEVYLLYAVAALIIFNLAHSFFEKRDVRYLFGTAFLSGVSAGAHAAIVIPAGITILAGLLKVGFRHKAITVAFGLIGLLVFSYLPLRAAYNPPLNSGGISSLSEFAGFVTNSRIGNLRIDNADIEASTRERVENFLVRLKNEIGMLWMMLGFVGLGILINRQARVGLLLVVFLASSFTLFLSWDPDPWALGMGLLTVSSAAVLQLIKPIKLLRVAVFLVLGLSAYRVPQSLQNYYTPEDVGLQILSNQKSAAELLEPGWFLGKSAAKIFQRSNPQVLFTPALLYPEAFSNTEISVDAQILSARASKLNHPTHSEFAFLSDIFKAYNNFQPPISLEVQPTQLTNAALKSLLILEDGHAMLRPGTPSAVTPDFERSLLSNFSSYRNVLLSTPLIAQSDARNYFESLVLGWTDLLTNIERDALATAGLDLFCQAPYEAVCSVVSINNYALRLIDAGRTAEATKLLTEIIDDAGDKRPVVRHNLQFAVAKLRGEIANE